MIKYTVNVQVNKISEDGNVSRIYTIDSTNPLDARRTALKKAKSLVSFFESKSDANAVFASFTKTEKNAYNDFTSYSVSVSFWNGDLESEIYGCDDEQTQLDNLSNEAVGFQNHNIDVELEGLLDDDGETIEVLAEDLNFLMDYEPA